ncbi:hypothetical protein E2C01_066989 [Portunus trituberculatus]|uniref:Uncharacterized protein n=1 Tax=Portunus trituberculatus TaxID=210409 RepID=A0A5B7HTV4_PORTR|nr:hypothetical protein [Portunus trituberculatus]
MTPRAVPAARRRLAFPALIPELTAVAAQVWLRSVQAHVEAAQAVEVHRSGHGPFNEAQELRAGLTCKNVPLEPKESLWCGEKVNTDGGRHAMNDDHLLVLRRQGPLGSW